MKRFKHSLSNYKLATFDMGKLIPVGIVETLPGDTIQQSTSMLLRMIPMLSPVMHPVVARIHHWFVPHRLTHTGWEDFITGGKDGLGSAIPYPTNAGTIVNTKNTVLDYMGVPPNSYAAGKLSMMPLMAYNMIYNEFYRDEDLVTEVSGISNVVQNVAWEKDYFTTARPWTQKGPAVSVPLGPGGFAQVVPDPAGGIAAYPTFKAPSGTPSGTLTPQTSGNQPNIGWDVSTAAANNDLQWDDPGLVVAASPLINDFRRAFALQRYQEARAQYGSRYTEYLRYLGVTPSDARVQNPQYLGGGKQTFSFSEVLDTAGVGQPVGSMKGHGIAALRSNRFRYFCEEHGFIITLVSLRPRTMYNNGIERIWSRRSKEDYYQKELELIGQQSILNKELYWVNGAADDNVFGYQDRYAEYRHQKSTIAADFRDVYNFWHLGRIFASGPVLNQSFVEADPSKRVFAVQTEDTILGMISHSVQARRMVGTQTIGRII